jgi:hypothetical protein
VNYFLGLTVCKLFADKLIDAPWLLHLDVYRHLLNPTFLTGHSRPDLVGSTNGGDWVAMESKGRATTPSRPDRNKAKQQALRIITVRDAPGRWYIGTSLGSLTFAKKRSVFSGAIRSRRNMKLPIPCT